MDDKAEFDNSEWQVRHRHEVATFGRATAFVTATDAQHNHDMQVLMDRLDLARAELVIARAEIVALHIIRQCDPVVAVVGDDNADALPLTRYDTDAVNG